MQGRITPENIVALEPNQIFVFGSNTQGRHGKGAAKTALNKFGAIWGRDDGLQGRSYGIATVASHRITHSLSKLPLDQVQVRVRRFVRFAAEHPELHFLVTAIGCGLAGYKPEDIAPMFKDAPENVRLPQSFWDVLAALPSS